MSTVELKPCPFCPDGGEPLVEVKPVAGAMHDTVRCQKCRAVAMYETWQSRTPAMPARSAEVQEAIRQLGLFEYKKEPAQSLLAYIAQLEQSRDDGRVE